MSKIIFERPKSLTDSTMSYCPGCGHGTVNRLMAEVIDELDMREKTIGVLPVGCAVTAYEYFNFDCSEAAHGRAAAVATGIKRVHPEKLVFSYQGDGDLASIGMGETIHTANRGENITVIFINNINYGMTGGQMAPTSLEGMKTATTPSGRNLATEGAPMRMAELLSLLPGVKYATRVTTADFKNILLTRAALKKAFQLQLAGVGYSFVEILTNCNTNWGLEPFESNKYILNTVANTFPIGTYKDTPLEAAK